MKVTTLSLSSQEERDNVVVDADISMVIVVIPVLQMKLVTGYNSMRKETTIRVLCNYLRDNIGYSNFVVESVCLTNTFNKHCGQVISYYILC